MIWNICFAFSLLIIVTTVTAAFFIRLSAVKRLQYKPVRTYLLIGLFVSLWCLLFPIAFESGQQSVSNTIKSLSFSLLRTIRLFGINDISFINREVPSSISLYPYYTLLMTGLCVCAPILTVSYILSLFKDLNARIRFFFMYKNEYYVFSHLNAESVTLAESIKRHHPGCGIIFAAKEHDYDSESEKRGNLLNAVIINKSILELNFSHKSAKSQIAFFAVSDDKDNISIALPLIKQYRQRKRTRLYVFSDSAESELLLSNTDTQNLKLKLICYPKTLVLDTLNRKGKNIFSNAKDNKTSKQISALIVGSGKYGQEMLKGLSWYCQIDGYDLSITAIDKDAAAYEKIYTSCPKLFNHQKRETDDREENANYSIDIISGMNAETKSFYDLINKIKPTYIFVSLGEDNLNLRTAAKLRTYCNEIGIHPYINSVLYDIDDYRNLKGITDSNDQPYEIDFIGDIKSRYSETKVIAPELEKEALKIHLSFIDAEEEFWSHEYNYYSSIATAIYMRALIEQKIPGAEKKKSERTQEENDRLNQLNNRRWRVYMDTQGYIYNSSFPYQDGWSGYN